MPQRRRDYRWGVLGHSQLGASHVRQGLPNQDAIRSYVLPDGSPPVALAVADGHGSSKCFRSHVGAVIAVETAVQVCRDFLERIGDAAPSTVKSAAEQQIPPRIFETWMRRVSDHWARNPFSEAELARLAEEAGPAARDRAASNKEFQVAYGATLLAVLLTSEFLICFQLGDGEILAVSDATGEVVRAVPEDESLIADETHSLSQEYAFKHVRYRFQLFQDTPPGLVLLSTDGYAKSFKSPEGFLKVGADYLEMIRADGADAVRNRLPHWLEETSREGGGDDITLGIIYRCQPPLSKPALGAPFASSPPDASGEGPPVDQEKAASIEACASDVTPPVSPLPDQKGFQAMETTGAPSLGTGPPGEIPPSFSARSPSPVRSSPPVIHAASAALAATEKFQNQAEIEGTATSLLKRLADGIGWVFGRKERG
jgi:serine/threonine protein phosphatase PrpC